MNEVEFIQQLAGAADGCRPPKLDAADRVLREIRRQETSVVGHVGWLITAASAAAVLLSVLVLQAWQSINDPLDDMLVFVNLTIS